MRFLLVFCVLFASLSVHAASKFTIPRKFRGKYKCELPNYELNHNGTSTKVEATTAILLVYKTKIIFRIGERSFPSNVERKSGSNRKPKYKAEFPAPFYGCSVTFDAKSKSVTIDLPIFQNGVFERVK